MLVIFDDWYKILQHLQKAHQQLLHHGRYPRSAILLQNGLLRSLPNEVLWLLLLYCALDYSAPFLSPAMPMDFKGCRIAHNNSHR